MMQDDVDFLCSDRCSGRAPGTPGHAEARAYLEHRLAKIGLEPAGTDGWAHPIAPHEGANLIGRIPGSGASSPRRVIVGAHYDHLGVIGGRMHRGAGDNASGVAVLLEAAQRVVEAGPSLDREVLIVLFDQEEPPYFAGEHMGSVQFVEDAVVPLDTIDMMITLDIVGVPLGPTIAPSHVADSVFVVGAD